MKEAHLSETEEDWLLEQEQCRPSSHLDLSSCLAVADSDSFSNHTFGDI